MRLLFALAFCASSLACSPLSAHAAEPCSSESKLFHGGSNELFQKCHCEAMKPPKAEELAQALGLTFEGSTVWSEKADGKDWFKCSLVYKYKDPARKKAPDCKSQYKDLVKKLSSEPALKNFAKNSSFLMCN
jgi:hypothetical protein